jgi:succinate dehydrogenase / fumarate reductase flavoprotein subunit
LFETAEAEERKDYERIVGQNRDKDKGENPWHLHAQLSEVMLRDCTIERHDDRLDRVLDKIWTVQDRLPKVRIDDTGQRANQSAQFVRHFENMVVLARVIAQGARHRAESRGAHYKPAHEKRDDANWLRTTLARYSGQGQVEFVKSFDYECAGKGVHVTDEVDVSLVQPRERKYEQAGAASEQARKEAPVEAERGLS